VLFSNNKRLVVIGSSGSIGTQTLDVVHAYGGYDVVGVAVHHSAADMAEQVERFHPRATAMVDADAAKNVVLPGLIRQFTGPDAPIELLQHLKPDTVMVCTPGLEALPIIIEALDLGCRVLVASKEPLCVAGDLLREKAGGLERLVPVDSELTGLWSLFSMIPADMLRRVYITASGGPFRGREERDLDSVTPKEALAHPRWSMGPKVTVDSATMVNKIIEVIAARRLFGLTDEQVCVAVHPQAYCHCAVELRNGNTLALLSETDMRISIAEALYHGQDVNLDLPRLDFQQSSLEFAAPQSWQQRVVELGARAAAHRRAALQLLATDDACITAFLSGGLSLSGVIATVEDAVDEASRMPDVKLGAESFAADIMTLYNDMLEEAQDLLP